MFKGPIAKATIRTSVALGLRLAVQATTLIILTKTLGPSSFGLYAGLGAMAVLLGTLASFGTHLTLLRDVSRSSLHIDNALRLALGTTTFCGSALLIIYLVFSQVLLDPPNDTLWIALCLGVTEILLQPFLVIAAMERHGRGQIARSQLLLIQPLIFRLITILAIAWCAPKGPLSWYALGHLIAIILPLTYVALSATSTWHQPNRWRMARRSDWRDLAGYAVMNASANGVAELDKMLAIRLLPINIAGVYSAASRIVSSLVLPVMAMMLSAMPRLFRDRSLAGKNLQWWLLATAGVYGLLACAVMLVAAPWIEVLLGTEYTGASEIISLLAFAIPAISVRTAATNIITTLERPWVRISLELAGWLIIVVLAYVFVNFYGNTGLALSVIAAEWLLAISSVILINTMSDVFIPSLNRANQK